MRSLSTKRSATRGILLEIKGENNVQLVEKLTKALRTTLDKFKNVRVHRPRQIAEIILVGIDVSITRDEIKTAVAREEGCFIDDVTVGSIKNFPKDIGFVWVKCRLAEANNLEKKKRIRIGWLSIKTNLLSPRRMEGFRCLRLEHTKARYDDKNERGRLCYNCGQERHRVFACTQRSKYVLCTEMGKPSNYRSICRRSPVHTLPFPLEIGALRRSPIRRAEEPKNEEKDNIERKDSSVQEKTQDMSQIIKDVETVVLRNDNRKRYYYRLLWH